MMETISLTPLDLAIAATLIVLLALLSMRLKLGISSTVLVAGLRTAVQLLLVGMILKWLFESAAPAWLLLAAGVMLVAAGREVRRRQKRPFRGWWSFGIGAVSMFLSSFTLTFLALWVIIGVEPWYTPRYAIPLLGMMLGNTMNGIALGNDRLTSTAYDQRETIEARLMLGQTWNEAIGDIRSASIRTGLIPILNAMAAAGLVSLPGMMTGQILGGNPPAEAVKYQILIMFLIAGGTGLGTVAAVWLSAHRLFDTRERLRLDRLVKGKG